MSQTRFTEQRLVVLFNTYQPVLRGRVAMLVRTSPENVEDACMFAWTQLLAGKLDDLDRAERWLLLVARHEALKLDRRGKRTQPWLNADGTSVEIVDVRDPIAARERAVDVATAITAADLSARESRIVGLQAYGLTHEEIAEATGETRRSVERQLGRAHRKVRENFQP
jgi:RNA polymerase sigma factor (sigma-70 family)